LQSFRFVIPHLTALTLILALASCGGKPAEPASNTQGNGGGTAPNSAVIANIEQSPWLTCGSCGNLGGVGTAPVYSATLGIASPSEDGASAQFSIAASVPFTNAYFFQKHAAVASQFSNLSYEFDIYVPAGSENAPQAIEFECQQVLDGWVYNFAWQAVYPSHVWRTFDYGANNWESSSVAFNGFSPGAWHHVMAEYHNDATAHTVIHDALTVDGTRYAVGITHSAFHSGAANNQFTNAIQLDSNLVPAPYSIYVDAMKITYR
jgi:hypothetical protein